MHTKLTSPMLGFFLVLGVASSAAALIQNAAFLSINAELQVVAVAAAVNTASVANENANTTSRASIYELNSQVAAIAKQYEGQTDPAKKKELLVQISKILAERKPALVDTLQKDPEKALDALLPANVIAKLPLSVASQVETDVNFQGDLTVIHVDDVDSAAERPLEYSVKSSNSGKEYRLRLKDEDPNLRTGAKIRVKGFALDNEVILAAGATTTTVIAPVNVITSSSHKTLAIIINFTNATNNFTQRQLQSSLFTAPTSVTAFYVDNSKGAVAFTGDVAGPYTIAYTKPSPMTQAECLSNTSVWASLALKAAATDGLLRANYDHLIYELPSGICPGISGLGSVGGKPSSSWIFGGYNAIYEHELGHNLGVDHANSLDCRTVQMAPYTSCRDQEYGDLSDVMGYSFALFNAPHRVALNWMSPNQIQTVSTSGTYTIKPLGSGAGVEVLKILKPNTSEAYYLSYRQPIGLFDVLPYLNGFIEGISIHIWHGSIASWHTKLVATTPGDGNRRNDTLLDGTSFADSANGIKITQISHGSGGVTADIQFVASVDSLAPVTSVTIAPTVKGKTSVFVTASDDISVTKVELYKDGSLLGTDTGAPYNFPWDTTLETNARHSLQSKAYDAAGHIGVSAMANSYVDNVPPTISLTAPLEGSVVSGVVAITTSASDNRGLSRLIYALDGRPLSIVPVSGMSTTSIYSLNTASLTDGPHTIQASVSDSASNITSSPLITVTVKNSATTTTDIVPPTTAITAPLAGSTTATVSGTTQITATASDNIGVTKVDFYRDNTLVSTDALAPYATTWSTASSTNGTHTLQSKAYDARGNMGVSNIVTVTVGTTGTTTTTADTTRPQVYILSPRSGAALDPSPTSTTTISTQAYDAGGIKSLSISIDGRVVKTCTYYFCTYLWSGKDITVGSHTITAIGIDKANNSASETKTVTK